MIILKLRFTYNNLKLSRPRQDWNRRPSPNKGWTWDVSLDQEWAPTIATSKLEKHNAFKDWKLLQNQDDCRKQPIKEIDCSLEFFKGCTSDVFLEQEDAPTSTVSSTNHDELKLWKLVKNRDNHNNEIMKEKAIVLSK